MTPRSAWAGILAGLADSRAMTRAWEAALAAPVWDQPPVWLHGDLHPANIIIHRGRISGVIDFGDITSGDPATDLSVAWMLLPAQYHDDFRGAYRAADNPQITAIGHRTLTAVLA